MFLGWGNVAAHEPDPLVATHGQSKRSCLVSAVAQKVAWAPATNAKSLIANFIFNNIIDVWFLIDYIDKI